MRRVKFATQVKFVFGKLRIHKIIIKNRVKAVFNYDKAKSDDAKTKNFFLKSPIKSIILIRSKIIFKLFLKRVLTMGICCVKM